MEKIIVFLILLLIMLAALVSEIITYDDHIHPYIWVAGGIIGLVCNVLGYGIVSWLEGVIAAVVLMILLLLVYSKISDSIGGGVLKGLLVMGMVLGRYSLLALINFIVICFATILIENGLAYWKGQLYYGAIFLVITVLLTGGEYFLIF